VKNTAKEKIAKMVIEKIKRTSPACPSQWEGILENGETVYIHYRNGIFSIGIGKNLDEAIVNNYYTEKGNDILDGSMSDLEMATKAIFAGLTFSTSAIKRIREEKKQQTSFNYNIIENLLNAHN
jgi:hypothetical protein